MRRRARLSREKADRMKEVRTAIGRGLTKQFDSGESIPDHLADLVRKIEDQELGGQADGHASEPPQGQDKPKLAK